jgi:hypothetical protein
LTSNKHFNIIKMEKAPTESFGIKKLSRSALLKTEDEKDSKILWTEDRTRQSPLERRWCLLRELEKSWDTA